MVASEDLQDGRSPATGLGTTAWNIPEDHMYKAEDCMGILSVLEHSASARQAINKPLPINESDFQRQ